MTKEQIKALFPLKGKLTQEILDNSDVDNVYRCPGTNTLKATLNNAGVRDVDILWGTENGAIFRDGIIMDGITTKECINFTEQVNPMTVTFILAD